MNTLTKTIIFFFLTFLLVSACGKDEDPIVEEEEMEEEEMVDACKDVDASYKDDISAILTGSCALSGCHVAGFSNGDFSSYEDVGDSSAKIKARAVDQKNMPPANSDAPKLTDAQLELLNCWIAGGALDN